MKIETTYIEMLADTVTPVQLYLNLRDEFPNSLLLEASEFSNSENSFSFICLHPLAEFSATGNTYSLTLPGNSSKTTTVSKSHDVGVAMQEFIKRFETDDTELPVNVNGVFGYSSFESVQYFEDIQFDKPSKKSKSHPDLRYQFFEYVIALDHFHNQLYVLHHSIDDSNQPDFERLKNLISVKKTAQFGFRSVGIESSNLTDSAYRKMVEKGIAHCQRGDVFQVVLSREFQQEFNGDEFNVYRTVRSINPSPYLFYFDYTDYKIFGSSPESQLQVTQDVGSINPIAGTVRRTGDKVKDELKTIALREDPKENAEHTMLVDLARNDLSKFAAGVSVDEYASVQNFSHVIHLVSTVSGQIFKEYSSLDVFGGTFPAGTLSGAPKYRALEIIDENEPDTRNFYGGAIGFFGFDGTVNHAIIIRSMLSKNNVLTYQAGAGIVVESKPENELQEVNNKVAAMRQAILKAGEI